MDRFVLRQNIIRFRRHLETERDPEMRQTVCQLLLDAERQLALLDAATSGTEPDTLDPISAWPTCIEGRRMTAAFQRDFETAKDPYLLIDPRPGLHIVDANEPFAAATLTASSRLVGQRMFDAFPDNPEEPTADGVSNLYASLCRVSMTGLPDAMATQRYDVRDSSGHFVERYWRPVNTPLFDAGGRLKCILNHAKPVPTPCSPR